MPPGTWTTVDYCVLRGNVICAAVATCPDGGVRQESWYQTNTGERLNESNYCVIPSDAQTRAPLRPGRILEAFRRLPLPESPLLIQPSGGETIVNFDTIFYTTQKPFTRTVRLLGHEVTFTIEPARFTWVWGDGEQATTTTPGRPYHHGVSVSHNLTHRYLTADRFRPRLDTTYTATYSVDGRAARPVNGTVTITGTPQDLRTVEYTPVLVDD